MLFTFELLWPNTWKKKGIIYFDSQIQVVYSVVAWLNALAKNIILVGTGVRDSSSNNNKKEGRH